jgi:hypothetical protein
MAEQKKISCRKKMNPIWWIGNENDPVDGLKEDGTEKHRDFYPKFPLWARKVMWGIRNPMHNFMFFVVGLADRPEIVNFGSVWAKEGQKLNIILPFISYRGDEWECYVGWRSGLKFGCAFRRSNSKSK